LYGKIEQTTNNIVNNLVTATRLACKTVFANTKLINTSFQKGGNNIREYFRIGVNATKKFHETTNEVAAIGFSTGRANSINTKTIIKYEDNNKKNQIIPLIFSFPLTLFYNYLMRVQRKAYLLVYDSLTCPVIPLP
jgi:hypothetical protein